jgi:hypothetical protein
LLQGAFDERQTTQAAKVTRCAPDRTLLRERFGHESLRPVRRSDLVTRRQCEIRMTADQRWALFRALAQFFSGLLHG